MSPNSPECRSFLHGQTGICRPQRAPVFREDAGFLFTVTPIHLQPPMHAALAVIVNDQTLEVQPGTTVGSLIAQLGINRQLVAVEKNGSLVAAKDFDITQIADGDSLEIVTLVGGG